MKVSAFSQVRNRFLHLKVLSNLLSLNVALALAAPVFANETRAPVFGGEIRVAINSDILSTNPGVLRDGNTDTVLYHVAEALVAYRDDLTVAPLLAERIEVSDDHTIYTFTLRRGVTFHNGAPLTTAEVKWSWDRLLDPSTNFRCLDYFDGEGANGLKLKQVEVLDDWNIAFHLNRPSAFFLDRMANIQCLTAILHPDSVSSDGSWREPIGTGPYRLGEWKKGRSVTLERFEKYSSRPEQRDGLTGRKIAYADSIEFVVTPDRIAAKSSVFAGNIDLLYAMPLSAWQEVQRRQRHRGDIKVYHHDTLDWTVLLMQSKDPLLSDVRMRKAIAHAVSAELVTTFSTFGLAQTNPSATQRLSPFHTALHDRWYEFDADKARSLAEQAGYDGEVITIQANRKFSYMFDNAVAIQAMLYAAGFNARIEVFDWATQLTNFFNGDFQLSSFGYSARSHPALLYGNFTGSKSVRKSYQWDDSEAFDLVSALEESFSNEIMQENLDRMHLEMIKQVPIIGLYNDHIIDISRDTIHGYESWAFGRPRLWGVWIDSQKD